MYDLGPAGSAASLSYVTLFISREQVLDIKALRASPSPKLPEFELNTSAKTQLRKVTGRQWMADAG
jgi:hypothetical protein